MASTREIAEEVLTLLQSQGVNVETTPLADSTDNIETVLAIDSGGEMKRIKPKDLNFGESENAEKIEAETKRAEGVEEQLNNSISDEVQRAQIAEQQLLSKTDAAETYLTIEGAEAEHESRLEAEQELLYAIATNRAERIKADETITAELEKKVEASDTALEVDSIEETLVTNALRKTAQVLTDAEKQQVQKNIGVNGLSNAITLERERAMTAEGKLNSSLLTQGTVRFDRIVEEEITINTGTPTSTQEIVYFRLYNKFVAFDGSSYWDTWDGMDAYMSNGTVRKDKVYLCGENVYIPNDISLISNEKENAIRLSALDLKTKQLSLSTGLEMLDLSVETIIEGAFISNTGDVTSHNGFSIKKVSVTAGDLIILDENASQYVAVFSKKINDRYEVVSTGDAPKIYLAQDKEDIYISMATEHTIEFYHNMVAGAGFSGFKLSEHSEKILDIGDWEEPKSDVLFSDSVMDVGGARLSNSNYNICRILVRKGDVVKIKGGYSQYIAVFAKRLRGYNSVVMIGSDATKEYEYTSTFTGVLVYNQIKNGNNIKILRSKVNNIYGGNPLYGKRILCLGDSITEFKNEGMGYPDWLALKTGAEVVCCGIGGTRLSARQAMVDTPSTSSEAYAALDIVNIVSALCYGNWSKQIAAAEWLKNNTADDNTAIVNTLVSLNIKSFDYITILAGTNDWTGDYAFGAPNPFGENTPYYVNSAISRIVYDLSANAPLVKLVAFTPLVRYAENRVDAQWSDVAKNRNRTLADFSLKLIKEWRANHIPCGDLYFGLGWNKYNFPAFFRADDNVHPFLGFEQIADKIIGYLNSETSTSNELCELFAQQDATSAVLGITRPMEYIETTVVAENSLIDSYGNSTSNGGYTLKSINVVKGDVVRLNQGTSEYVSVFAKKENGKYIPLVIGKGGLCVYECAIDFDGVLYYSLPDGYDDISKTHSDLLSRI